MVGASNLEWRPVKGLGTVVAGCGRDGGHGDNMNSSWHELGYAVWRGLATWRASTRCTGEGQGHRQLAQ